MMTAKSHCKQKTLQTEQPEEGVYQRKKYAIKKQTNEVREIKLIWDHFNLFLLNKYYYFRYIFVNVISYQMKKK